MKSTAKSKTKSKTKLTTMSRTKQNTESKIVTGYAVTPEPQELHFAFQRAKNGEAGFCPALSYQALLRTPQEPSGKHQGLTNPGPFQNMRHQWNPVRITTKSRSSHRVPAKNGGYWVSFWNLKIIAKLRRERRRQISPKVLAISPLPGKGNGKEVTSSLSRCLLDIETKKNFHYIIISIVSIDGLALG